MTTQKNLKSSLELSDIIQIIPLNKDSHEQYT